MVLDNVKMFKIGVFGSAVGSKKEIEEKAYLIGKAIAEQNCILTSGGGMGLPHIASKGAFENSGKVIAFSSCKNMTEHNKRYETQENVYTDHIFIPEDYPYINNKFICFKYRNVTSCAASDAGIIIGGRIGTLNEFTNLYDMGKVIGVLVGSEGPSELIPKIIEKANKNDAGAIVIYEKDPVELVKKIIDELKRRAK